jgi:2-succinyl-5-enolpyruvyl-6-hydroxy-3-cyclohexene-1-carboxylate synthase
VEAGSAGRESARPLAQGLDGACAGVATASLDAASPLAGELSRVERGVLVLGPDVWDPLLPGAVGALAAVLGWPVLADPASGLRGTASVPANLICGADLVLRHAPAAARLRPDLVVRFGGLPTSKAVNEWIGRHAQAGLWLVDPAGDFRDPQHRASRSLRLTSRQFCLLATATMTAARAQPAGWLAEWRRADDIARRAAAAALDADPRFLTPHLARALWAGLPEDALLYVANSMAIREVDAFTGPRSSRLRVLANRGVNGIDGLVSAACGAATAAHRPSVLWCGDLAMLHDVSGLLAGRMHGTDLTVVVSNDDGGGIFEYLPAAKALPRAVFERMFAVPHGLDLVALARGLGWEATRAGSAADFERALARSIGGGRHVIEVPVNRAENTAFHATVHEAVGDALRREFVA